jgi:hypothetical protein
VETAGLARKISIVAVCRSADQPGRGSFIAHATMHTTAVAHIYETDVFLPPETEAK